MLILNFINLLRYDGVMNFGLISIVLNAIIFHIHLSMSNKIVPDKLYVDSIYKGMQCYFFHQFSQH